MLIKSFLSKNAKMFCFLNNFSPSFTVLKASSIAENYYLKKKNKLLPSSHVLPCSSTISFKTVDTCVAYKNKSLLDLIRGLIVLKLSSYDYLINNGEKLIKLTQKIFPNRLFEVFMKLTFYGQFVAGENEEEIKPKVAAFKSYGIKCILNYCKEEDYSKAKSAENKKTSTISKFYPVSTQENNYNINQETYQFQAQIADEARYHVLERAFFFLNEAKYEKNMETFIKSIDTLAKIAGSTGFVAIKLTALGNPQILIQLSEIIEKTKPFLSQVSKSNNNAQAKKIDTLNNDPITQNFFDKLDCDKKELINICSWNGLVNFQEILSDNFKVFNLKTREIKPITSVLTSEEEEMFRNMMKRIHEIAKHAKNRDVPILVDAEQTYFQSAINRITLEMMKKYNTEKSIIYNTYQCYLKNALNTVTTDIETMKKNNFYFGAKLVRGAYLSQERLRAKELGYEDPVNESYNATTKVYNQAIEYFLNQIKVIGVDTEKLRVMIATHNEETVSFTIERIKKLNIKPDQKVVCFGQLYGMSDHISYLLSQFGYSVYKWVPYGSVNEVMPYLSRRASENHEVLEKAAKEIALYRKEIFRRLFSGQIFYKPSVKY